MAQTSKDRDALKNSTLWLIDVWMDSAVFDLE
jgi:hypothetical protein